ncbi:MAG TPA: hypothetical protein ENJ16_02720 [Planctomycetaceae bacterium]|nr:hypothetical protein [Planctomycetaceae bacterium]
MKDKNRIEEIAQKAWEIYLHGNASDAVGGMSWESSWQLAEEWVRFRDEKLAEANRDEPQKIGSPPVEVGKIRWVATEDSKRTDREKVYEEALETLLEATDGQPPGKLVCNDYVRAVCNYALHERDVEDAKEEEE